MPKRRWLRFTTRGLFVATAIIALYLGYFVNASIRQKQVIDKICAANGMMQFRYEYHQPNSLELFMQAALGSTSLTADDEAMGELFCTPVVAQSPWEVSDADLANLPSFLT